MVDGRRGACICSRAWDASISEIGERGEDRDGREVDELRGCEDCDVGGEDFGEILRSAIEGQRSSDVRREA